LHPSSVLGHYFIPPHISHIHHIANLSYLLFNPTNMTTTAGSASTGDTTAPWFATLTSFSVYCMMFFFGYLRDFFAKLFRPAERTPDGYAPLLIDFEDFYTRRMYRRIQDCWNRPIASAPGACIDVMLRESKDYNKTLTLTGKTRRCLNLGSYNYLGFGDPSSTTKPAVLKAIDKFGACTGSTRLALGTTTLHAELEVLVARFVRKPDAMVFGMGFGTNSTGIPALIGKGGLIISDSNNHSSLVSGARSSGAKIMVFKHNDPEDLEAVVRRAIVSGQPRTHRPWNRILIVVEGIYSMEGEICPLQEIVRIKKKYKCYLYLDEAHSIGALGATGRGVCEHTGVDPNDVDILMGTFTKSFGAVGGYIASSKETIAYLRRTTAGSVYSQSISPPACQQCISAIKIILGEDGTDIGKKKLRQLKENANYVRRELNRIGYALFWHDIFR